jgi:Tn3 transposase DDE domain
VVSEACAQPTPTPPTPDFPDTLLVLNVMVLWNTIYIEAALEQLRQNGRLVQDEDLARLSPLIHDHINLLER